MNLLLDTNAFIWLIGSEPERIGRSAAALIQTAGLVSLSSVSVCEIVIKRLLGKLDFPGSPSFEASRSNIAELPFSAHHAEMIEQLGDLVHHDPFDRMLIATAISENAIFITGDQALLGLNVPGLTVIDARL